MITFQFLFTVFIIEGVQTLLHVIKWKTALVCFIPWWLCKLLCCCDSIICTAYNHGHLVAAWLLQDTLQLPHCALNSGPCAEVHFTDNNEDGNLQCHGKAKMLPCGTSWKRMRRRGRKKEDLPGILHCLYLAYYLFTKNSFHKQADKGNVYLMSCFQKGWSLPKHM